MTTKKQSEWYKSRPDCIKKMIDKIPMDGKYRMKKTGKDYYTPYSYREDGTLRVIRWDFTTGKKMWLVFGVKPEDLIPTGG